MKESKQNYLRVAMKSKNDQTLSQIGQKDFPVLGTIPPKTQVTKEFMKEIKLKRKRGIYIQQ